MTMKKFPELLKEQRERLGLTQAETAVLLDVSLRAYATWERGDGPTPLILTQEGALARLSELKPKK